MKKVFYCLAGLALALAIAVYGCDRKSSEEKKEKPSATEATAEQTTAPVGQKTSSPAFQGKVAETMDAGNYTYARLDNGSGKEIWVAVPKTELKVGEEVLFQGGDMMLEDFKSKTLNRTFEKIIFATGVFRLDGQEIAGGSAAGSDSGDTVMLKGSGASGGSAANIVPFEGLKVEKASAPDAYGVGEIFEKASLLDGKHVIVRGKIVKVSKNIMGKNWIHIQDGTGDPGKNTCDLVVTTMDTAETGDIVTVEGRAAAARDFGFGYKYDVIVEDAKISRDEGGKTGTI